MALATLEFWCCVYYQSKNKGIWLRARPRISGRIRYRGNFPSARMQQKRGMNLYFLALLAARILASGSILAAAEARAKK